MDWARKKAIYGAKMEKNKIYSMRKYSDWSDWAK